MFSLFLRRGAHHTGPFPNGSVGVGGWGHPGSLGLGQQGDQLSGTNQGSISLSYFPPGGDSDREAFSHNPTEFPGDSTKQPRWRNTGLTS